MFREDFVWGVATSAHQIEGSAPELESGKNVWDMFTEKGKCKDGQTAERTCDHVHRYKEDFRLMKQLGIKAYRFSLSWARILPEGTGKVSEKGIAFYRDMILEMKKNGITPYITMFHWDMPLALYEKGGWSNEECVEWFGEYAKVCAENFSDICEYFITLNEPQCFVGLGHMVGCHAPGDVDNIKNNLQIAHNAMKAHGMAVIQLRKYALQPIKIGYAPTGGVAMPASDRPEDIEAARKTYFGMQPNEDRWYWNVSMFSDPVFLGHYPEEGLKKYKEYLPVITKEDLELIHQPLDFMGQNIYNGYYVKAGQDGKPTYVSRKEGALITASKWPVTPDCLYWGMKFLYERYHLPIYITENGMSSADVVSGDGQVHDAERIYFLDQYLSSLQKANDEGVDVAGYFQWSFLDNFEWEKGYSERFGMVYVDFETQERIAKDSALWYKETMECNGRNLSINREPKHIVRVDLPFQQTLRNDRTNLPGKKDLGCKIISEFYSTDTEDDRIRAIYENYQQGAYFGKVPLEEVLEAYHIYKEWQHRPKDCSASIASNANYQIGKIDLKEQMTIDSTYAYLFLTITEGEGLINGKLVEKGNILLVPDCMKQVKISGNMKMITLSGVQAQK